MALTLYGWSVICSPVIRAYLHITSNMRSAKTSQTVLYIFGNLLDIIQLNDNDNDNDNDKKSIGLVMVELSN